MLTLIGYSIHTTRRSSKSAPVYEHAGSRETSQLSSYRTVFTHTHAEERFFLAHALVSHTLVLPTTAARRRRCPPEPARAPRAAGGFSSSAMLPIRTMCDALVHGGPHHHTHSRKPSAKRRAHHDTGTSCSSAQDTQGEGRGPPPCCCTHIDVDIEREGCCGGMPPQPTQGSS